MAKRKCNPTSIRLSEELESDLLERCNRLGCSKNDFVKNAVKLALYDEADFDFDLDEPKQEEKTVNQRLDNSQKPRLGVEN